MGLTRTEFDSFFSLPLAAILATVTGDGWRVNSASPRFDTNGEDHSLIVRLAGENKDKVTVLDFTNAVLGKKGVVGTVLERISELNIVLEKGPEVKFA